MLDDFFGRLLPFRLGVIEQGRVEHPEFEPIPIHFMAKVVDGLVKADFSVDDSATHVRWLFPDDSTGQLSLRIGDADPFPIGIEDLQSYIPTSHGSLIFELASVNPNAEMAHCSFTVSGLPHFYHPLTFSETGPFSRSERGRDRKQEDRPAPHFQSGEYEFQYVLEETTEHPSCYRVSFHRIDSASMNIGEAERLIEIWAGLLGFVSGVYRHPSIVIGWDNRHTPVYGSWRNASDPLPLNPHNWTWSIRPPFDFYEFAPMFVKSFLEEENTDLLEWFLTSSTLLEYSDSASVVSSFAILERLTKDKMARNQVGAEDITNMLQAWASPVQ